MYNGRKRVPLRAQTPCIRQLVQHAFEDFTQDMLFSQQFLEPTDKIAHQRDILIACARSLAKTDRSGLISEIKMRLKEDFQYSKDLINVVSRFL